MKIYSTVGGAVNDGQKRGGEKINCKCMLAL